MKRPFADRNMPLNATMTKTAIETRHDCLLIAFHDLGLRQRND